MLICGTSVKFIGRRDGLVQVSNEHVLSPEAKISGKDRVDGWVR